MKEQLKEGDIIIVPSGKKEVIERFLDETKIITCDEHIYNIDEVNKVFHIPNMKRRKLNQEQVKVAKLCEIAYIFGNLVVIGSASQPFDDLEDAYKIYEEIYEDWINHKDIRNEGEQVYITAYASRVIMDKYSVMDKSNDKQYVKFNEYKVTNENRLLSYNNGTIYFTNEPKVRLLIDNGYRPHLMQPTIEKEVIKYINYFEEFYDKGKLVLRAYKHIDYTLTNIPEYSFDDVQRYITLFINDILPLINKMNEDNKKIKAGFADSHFMVDSIILKILVPIVNMYLTKRCADYKDKKDIIYTIFSNAISLNPIGFNINWFNDYIKNELELSISEDIKNDMYKVIVNMIIIQYGYNHNIMLLLRRSITRYFWAEKNINKRRIK